MIRVGKRLDAQAAFYGHRVDFYLTDFDNDGKRRLSKIEFEPFDEGLLVAPSFSIDLDVAQEFFEQLWAQGFRSKNDLGNAPALDAARKEHIADLRKAAKLT